MYKGDVSPKEAYEALLKNSKAVLIDVRTPQEWTYVGIPDMPGMLQVSWPPLPETPDFAMAVNHLNVPFDAEIYLICRSGFRSARGATELTAAGYENCYNVAQGFEGDRDQSGHRGTIGGWKVAGLPWVQS